MRRLVLTLVLAGCGDDARMDDPMTSTMTAGGSTSTADTDNEGGETSSSSTAEPGSGSEEGSSSTSGASTTTGSAADDDPTYPRPSGGTCGDGAPVELPGGSICEPFCSGPEGVCPMPATGDAAGVCTPFEMPGGSGGTCMDHDECPPGEGCGNDGTCVAVSFWACQLDCSGGQACPDAMVCTTLGACAYG